MTTWTLSRTYFETSRCTREVPADFSPLGLLGALSRNLSLIVGEYFPRSLHPLTAGMICLILLLPLTMRASPPHAVSQSPAPTSRSPGPLCNCGAAAVVAAEDGYDFDECCLPTDPLLLLMSVEGEIPSFSSH